MSRRKDNGEIAFGSDSFLDVLANIVGVLIILVVLVGSRIQDAPPDEGESTSETVELSRPSADWQNVHARWQAAKSKIDAENLAAELQQRYRLAQRADEIEEQTELARQRQAQQADLQRQCEERLALVEDVAQRQAEIDRQTAELERRIMESEAKQGEIEGTIVTRRKARSEAQAELQEKITAKEREAADLQTRLQSVQSALDKDAKAVEDAERQIVDLKGRVQSAKLVRSESKKLIHRPTPLARAVETHELHFRCKNGRLAYTYLDELLEATKEHASARISPSTMRLEGAVGPIGGFRLRYVLARPPASMSEQLTEVLFRFSLIHWELAPDSDNIGEPSSEVLESNSSFRVKLRSAPATKHAITLWVYPDSFSLAKRVEGYLQEQGYTVSLRPLPSGIPIIGSPYGSSTHSH